MSSSAPYLSVRSLGKAFGPLSVVRDLDMTVTQGEFVTLLGPSGCGKSTLLRCLAGLETVDTGSIVLDGQDITDQPPQTRNIGMVFQHYALFPTLRVIDNVLFGLRQHRVAPAEALERAHEALARVHLTDKARALPQHLSGGQQQRVALARALVVKPRILLLDEPFSALDAQIRRSVRAEVRRLQKDLGLTTILVTHDQEEAFAVSDRIFLMHQGAILQEGPPHEVYSRPRAVAAARFLGNYNVFGPGDLDAWKWIPSNPSDPRPTFAGSTAVAPEELNLVSAPLEPPAGGLTTPGVVEDALPLGALRRYHVTVGATSLTVDQLNAQHDPWLTPGDSVWVRVKPSSVRPLEAS